MYYIDRKEATQKIEQLLPSLYRGAASYDTAFASDVMAHIGWADWIRQKGDMYHLNVKGQFEKALEIDPENMYANTMMGHWLLASRIGAKDNLKKLDAAMKHFAVAIDSNRDRDYIRLWQFKALRTLGQKGDEPVLQLANDLQKNKEELSWPVCREALVIFNRLWTWRDDEQSEKELRYFVSLLRPEELLETYLWLNREINYKENIGVPYGYNIFIHKFIIARLTEESGNYSKALTQYRAVISQLDQMELRKSDGEWHTKEKFKRAVARVSQR
jgi:tetratricopeptide (TPR) repeat protein